MTTGWQCPACHHCYAPHVDECRWCNTPPALPAPHDCARCGQMVPSDVPHYCYPALPTGPITSLDIRSDRNG